MNSASSGLIVPGHPAWQAVSVVADDGTYIAQRSVMTGSMLVSVDVASRIGSLVNEYAQADPAFNTQITLRSWRVEINIAADKGEFAPSQIELVASIDEALEG